MTMRRVLICGDVAWRDKAMIREFVASLPDGTLVIEGGRPGAETTAREAALTNGLPLIEMPAAYLLLGNRAGPIRNQWMLDYCIPTEVHGFHDNFADPNGIRDMFERAERRGIITILHSHAPAAVGQ